MDTEERAELTRTLQSQAQRRNEQANPTPRAESGAFLPRPAYHERVHGLSTQVVNPGTSTEHLWWRVTCDGCGDFAEGPRVAPLVLTCGITFNPRRPEDPRRLCHSCGAAAWGADR